MMVLRHPQGQHAPTLRGAERQGHNVTGGQWRQMAAAVKDKMVNCHRVLYTLVHS
jgi:hypothetical protein